jgi:triacylglycerol lipase
MALRYPQKLRTPFITINPFIDSALVSRRASIGVIDGLSIGGKGKRFQMLSRLLRRLLVCQVLLCTLIAWLISSQFHDASWLTPVIAVLVFLVTHLLFVLAFAVKSYNPGQYVFWWRSVFGEYVAALRVYLFSQPWTKSPPIIGLPLLTPARVPVILVHGYLCNHRVWDRLARKLRQAGHPVLAVDLEPLFTSIDEYSPQIEQAVTQICLLTGAPKVALIGHSMGGLVIRAWMRANGAERVARVITLGTPHQGTKIDLHPKTANGKQMLWHSDWLKTLEANETQISRQLIRIALTPQDNIVFPQSEQGLAGVPITTFAGLGHLELSQNRQVLQWIDIQLNDMTV